MTIDETNGVNAHGLRISSIVQPGTQDADANGVWALWCLPDETSTIPTIDNAFMEAETKNAFLWATGNFAATNQTPDKIELEIRTSRNCQNGARIVWSIRMNTLTAGTARVRTTCTYFTKGL